MFFQMYNSHHYKNVSNADMVNLPVKHKKLLITESTKMGFRLDRMLLLRNKWSYRKEFMNSFSKQIRISYTQDQRLSLQRYIFFIFFFFLLVTFYNQYLVIYFMIGRKMNPNFIYDFVWNQRENIKRINTSYHWDGNMAVPGFSVFPEEWRSEKHSNPHEPCL